MLHIFNFAYLFSTRIELKLRNFVEVTTGEPC